MIDSGLGGEFVAVYLVCGWTIFDDFGSVVVVMGMGLMLRI